MPSVQRRPKWENPSVPKEEPRPAPLEQIVENTEQKWPQQTNEPMGLQKLDEPNWSIQVNLMESPQQFICPPPGFKPLPKLEVQTNLARPRAPPDMRLFPDQNQLMAAYQLAQGEQDSEEILPSLSSLQEYYSAQDLEVINAQQMLMQCHVNANSNSPEYPLESDGPRAILVEFSSVEQLKPMQTTIESSSTSQNALSDNTCQQKGTKKSFNSNKLRADVPEFLPKSQQKPTIPIVEQKIFTPLPLSGMQNSVDNPNSLDLPRTVQVEFSSLEQLRPARPFLPQPSPQAWPMPSIHPVAPTNFSSVPNGNSPFSDRNENLPPWTVAPAGPLFNYGVQNMVPIYRGKVHNYPLLYPPCHLFPPGLPPPPLVPYSTRFQNNGMMVFPPHPPRPPMPVQMFNRQMHPPIEATTQLEMPCPNYKLGSQQQGYFQDPSKKLMVPRKKILEIKSPTSQNVPHAASLSNKVQGWPMTRTPAELGKDPRQSKSKESMDKKNTSESSLQTDGSLDEGPNLFSQSTSPLKSDLVEDTQSPINEASAVNSISDGIERDGPEKEDHDTSQDLAFEATDNSEESNVEEDSLDEFEVTKVCPRSSTPHSQPDQDILREQEVAVRNDVEHSSIPAEIQDKKPSTEKTIMERSITTTSKRRRFISSIDVAGKHLNVFWLDGHPHLEVELLLGIGKLRIPVALKIVKTKSIRNKIYELKAKQNPEIFDEMAELGICHVNNLISPNAKILLVRLYDVSELLSSINVSDPSYMKELHSQVYLHSIE